MKKGLPDFDLKLYFGILRKRRYAALGATLASLTVFTFFALIWKSSYLAESTVFVSNDAVMNELVKNVGVSSSPDEQMENLTDSLTSRDMLEQVIKKLGLLREADKRISEEMLEKDIKKRLKILIKRDSENDEFIVSYASKDPGQAVRLVNTLVNDFITKKTNGETVAAERDFEFLGKQLAGYKADLDSYNGQIKAYEQSHPSASMMPKEAVYAGISSLQSIEAQSELKLNELLAKRQSLLDLLSGNAGTSGQDTSEDPFQGRLNALNARLADLLVRYTEDYPDVQRVKSEIKELNEQITPDRKTGKESPAYNRLEAELKKTDSGIGIMRAQLQEFSKRINLGSRAAAVSEGDQKMERLQRERDINEKTYDELLQKYAAARLTKDLVFSAKTTNFKIEPAVLPENPVRSNKLGPLSLGLLAAVLCGVGLAFGLEYLDDSLKSETDLASEFGLNVLASIPAIVTEEAKTARKKRDGRIFAAAGAYIIFFCVLFLNEAIARFAGIRLVKF